MIEMLRRACTSVPNDALAVIAVAFFMPVLLLIHMAMPTQTLARATFSVSLGLLGLLIGVLIEYRSAVAGYAIGCVSVGVAAASAGSLVVLHWWHGAPEPTITVTWRTMAGAQQIWIVVAWGWLALLRHRWLSKKVARGAFLVALIGCVWYFHVNFHLLDHLASNAWGPGGRTLSARVATPFVEPILMVAIWGWCLFSLRQWLVRARPIHNLRQ